MNRIDYNVNDDYWAYKKETRFVDDINPIFSNKNNNTAYIILP